MKMKLPATTQFSQFEDILLWRYGQGNIEIEQIYCEITDTVLFLAYDIHSDEHIGTWGENAAIWIIK